MEKQPQADSAEKSPASKTSPPVPVTESENNVANSSNLIQNVDKKDNISSTTYQDSKSVDNKLDSVSSSEAKPIISVDIQKSAPCDIKEAVPQKSETKVEVPPEVLASVVTNAVVKEAALTVSGTDGSIVTSTQLTKDSSKVDAVVEQEISKLTETKSNKTDVKFLEKTDSESKPLLNGDIDHSPVGDVSVEQSPKSAKDSEKPHDSPLSIKEEIQQIDGEGVSHDMPGEEKISQKGSSKDDGSDVKEKIEKIDLGSHNGVPGIITVESITKKESVLSTGSTKVSSAGATSDDDTHKLESADDTGRNLTDSAKLKKELLTESEKSSEMNGKIDNGAHKSVDEPKSASSNDVVIKEQNKIDSDKEDKTSVDSNGKKGESKEETTQENKISKEVISIPVDDRDLKDTNAKDSKEKETMKENLSSKQTEKETVLNSHKGSAPNEGEKTRTKEVSNKEKDSEKINNDAPETEEVCDMTSMMTSQILTPADLGIDESDKHSDTNETQGDHNKITTEIDSKHFSDSEDKSEVIFERCAISATRNHGATCDVGSGRDEIKMVRVAGPAGGEEEVDGQQASAEVEVTEDGITTEDTNEGTNVITNGTSSPTNQSHGSPTPSKIASATSTKSSSDASQADKDEKPASAVSRKSIPDPVTYEPPERRKSAASVSHAEKKDVEGDKSQLDEKETEKDNKERKESNIENMQEKESEGKDIENEEKVELNSEKESNLEKENEEESKEKEKGEEDANEKETIDDNKKSEVSLSVSELKEKENAEERDLPPSDNKEADDISGEGNAEEKEQKEVKDKKADESEVTIETKEEKEVDSTSNKDVDDQCEKENSSKMPEETEEIKSLDKGDTEKEEFSNDLENDKSAEKDTEEEDKDKVSEEENKSEDKVEKEEINSEDKVEKDENKSEDKVEKEDENQEEAIDETNQEKSEAEKLDEHENADDSKHITDQEKVDTQDKKEGELEIECKEIKENESKKESEDLETEEKGEKEENEVSTLSTEKVTEEPKTLVEETNTEEPSEKETKSEEKEEDETEKETTPEEKEVDIEKAELEAEKEEAAQTDQEEEKKEVPEAAEVAAEVNKEKEEETNEVPEQEEKPKETVEDNEDEKEVKEEKEAEADLETEKAEEQEKQDEGKEEAKEKPPKSPTKRSGSPTKGRRGVSPLTSPPKALKTPPSPPKQPKSTSPKKKNGMLSPIKTPKTPGSDIRKLPPIKAPVGFAPNPNLKNIRSKIGSFDNIKYKPGGGDKKVITKKLEWKATPKIGSLDHSHKRHRSVSKGESKDGKHGEGQSPLPSGDEGDGEGPATVAETLIKPDGGGSTEMPTAITAES